MGRRKASSSKANPPVTTLVLSSTANLGELLERALRSANERDVATYLARGGMVHARGQTDFSDNATLLHAAVVRNAEETVRLLKRNSRRYAKRQVTWFQRQQNFQPLNLSLLGFSEATNLIAQTASRMCAAE